MPTYPADVDVHTTFDPASDAEWEQLRSLGHRMLDDMLSHLQTLADRPVWQQMPPDVVESLAEAIPHRGAGIEAPYDDFRTSVLPYPIGNYHPRFFGWVQGNGTPYAMLADMLASGLNSNVGGFNQAPIVVERQVISWFAELFGLHGASGQFVSGGTMANILGVAVARFEMTRRFGRDIRRHGLQVWPGESSERPLVFYGSSETHGWAVKAAEWLGLGNRAFRRVPVAADYCIDIDALSQQIAEDRHKGLQPFCVIGTAGTVNTGATDDLMSLADICEREQLWFHVDGAFGSLIQLSPKLRHIVQGIDRADSLGFDLHKWGSMPFDCACVLLRNPETHHEAFCTSASYLARATRGAAAGGVYFGERGIDLSRSFKALKVWMSLKADGVDKLARIIEQNVAQVQHLVARVDAAPELALMAPAPLNIACFRYVAPEFDDVALDALNEELLLRLQERGIAVPSSTRIDGRFAIRVAHVNHRTRLSDIDMLVDSVIAIGDELRLEKTQKPQ